MSLRPSRSRLLMSPLLLATLLAASACSSQDEAAAPAAAPAADTTAAAPAPATTAATADAAPDAGAQAEPGPIVPPAGPAPVAGTDYVEIPAGQPFAPGSGKIEVVEVFGYTCPACAQFEPVLDAWKAKLPADVRVVPVAAPFGGYWEPYAKAFYAADTLGLLDQTHDEMFRAVHIERSLPVQPAPTNEQIAAFYGQQGADADAFANAMSSFAVDAKMKRARQFLTRSGVESTPTLIVNGKYRVIGGRTYEDVLRITDHLVAQERAASAPAASGDAAAADAPVADAAAAGG